MSVRTQAFADLDRATMARHVALWLRVWPQADRTADEVVEQRLTDAAGPDGPQRRAERLHWLEHGGVLVAQARSFYRQIRTGTGERTILALASVCSDPDRRGGGFGRRVVEAAFARLDASCPVAFFQTQVPAFYRRLGCRAVDNQIINGTGEGRAFWDPHAMIYPAIADWPTGEIDLLGPGW